MAAAQELPPEDLSLVKQSLTGAFELALQGVHQPEFPLDRERSEAVVEVQRLSGRASRRFFNTQVILTPDPEQFADLDWHPRRSRSNIQEPLARLNPRTAQIIGECNQAIDTAMAIAPETRQPLAAARAVNTLSLQGALPIEQLQALSPGMGSSAGLMAAFLEAEQNANRKELNVNLKYRELVEISPVPDLTEDVLTVCDFEVEVADLPVSPPLVLTQRAIYGDRRELDPIREILSAYTDLLVKTKRTRRAPDNPPYLGISSTRLHQYLRTELPMEFERRIKAAAEKLLRNENYGPLGKTLQTLCLTTTLTKGLASANEALRQEFPRW